MCACRDVTRLAPVGQRMKRCHRCSNHLGAESVRSRTTAEDLQGFQTVGSV